MHRVRHQGLDGLRGFASLHVAALHLYGTVGFHPAIAKLFAPVYYGLRGVPLFLVLSGFVLTASELQRRQPQGLATYYRRRWVRMVLPFQAVVLLHATYWVAVTGISGPGAGHRGLSVRQVVSHLFLVHGFFPDTLGGISTHFWTLSVIAQFYLVFPLLIWLARRLGAARVLGGLVAASLAWSVLVHALVPGWFHLMQGVLLGRLPEFGLGMLAAFWVYRPDPARTPWRVPAAAAVAALATAVVLKNSGFEWTPPCNFAFGVGYAAVIVLGCHPAVTAGWAGRVMSHRALIWFGSISYSLYLTHDFVLMRVVGAYVRLVRSPTLASDVLYVLAACGAVVGFAYLFHQWVERRCARWERGAAGVQTVAVPHGGWTATRRRLRATFSRLAVRRSGPSPISPEPVSHTRGGPMACGEGLLGGPAGNRAAGRPLGAAAPSHRLYRTTSS